MDDHQRLRALLDSAVDGNITIDERGLMEAVNPAAERLFGYSAAELVGRNVKMLMPNPYRDQHDSYLANFIRTGHKKIIGIGREVEGRRKDGIEFPLYLAVSEVSFGHRRVFTGFLHDLTDLRRVEQQATQLGRILENSLNEIFLFDTETLRFLFANHGARENMGYTVAQITRLTPLDIDPNLTDEHLRSLTAPLLSGEKSVVSLESTLKRSDGSLYDVDIRFQTATWEGRRAIVAIMLDITDRKRVQRELAILNARLEQRVEERTAELQKTQQQLVRREMLAVLGQLSGGVAHEIRNPLGIIRNAVYYLKMVADRLDDEGKACVNEIDMEVTRANRIVSELLDFTRDPEPNTAEVDLKELLLNAIKASAIPDDIQLDITGIQDDLTVNADQGQIERVMINLLRNACQAIADDGEISVSTTIDPGTVTVHVRDSGEGIPPDHLDDVFEPLFTTKARGIGLGLAVSRRYAEHNGGSLTVESQAGQGTVFHLSLRRAENPGA